MGKILGIIGGGQLGMMIAEAAKKMPDEITEIIVLDPPKIVLLHKLWQLKLLQILKIKMPLLNWQTNQASLLMK